MANQIVQKLIAAGASPQKAQAFAQQFAASRPGVKPQKLEDAFDEELRTLSEAVYPSVFRPPTIDDPKIDSYITGLFGADKLQQLQTNVLKQNSPSYFKVKNSIPADPNAYNLDQYIVAKIENGIPYAQIVNDIFEKAPVELMGALTEGKVADIVSLYYNEYDKAQSAFPVAKEKLLSSNKYYKAGLPDPKFVYDKNENLEQGKIAWTTHPSVRKIIAAGAKGGKVKEELAQTYGPAGPQSSAAAGIAALPFEETENLFMEFKASGATPFNDELKRRESLKGKTFK
jgi:hypothetical protein